MWLDIKEANSDNLIPMSTVAKFGYVTAGVILVVVLIGCATPEEPSGKSDDTYFYSGGRKVPVRIATDRVAVRMREDGSARERLRSLMRRNVRLAEEEELEAFPSQRFFKVRLQERVTREGLRTILRELERDPEIEMVGTVLLTEPSGVPFIMIDRLVARFKEKVSVEKMEQIIQEYGLEVVRISSQRRGRVVLQLRPDSDRDALEIANALFETELVTFAHPDFFVKTELRSVPNEPFFPNDTFFDQQWHLHNTGRAGGTPDADIDAPEAWDYTRGNHNVVIAVLDDGVDIDHEDLAPKIVAGGFDFIDNDNDPRPEDPELPLDPANPGFPDDHGTAVAGVAVAGGDNGLGVSGSCPECGLLPIRIPLKDDESIAEHADAFDHAVAQGASIISNSWGYSIGTPLFDDIVDAINHAAVNGRDGLGSVVLFAMHNDHVDDCIGETPDISSLENVIAVSGSTNQDRKVVMAGFGACMDLLAPTWRGKFPNDPFTGTLNITTTDRSGDVGYNNSFEDPNEAEPELANRNYTNSFGGTSSATPLVAGIAGLLLSLNPDLTRTEVQQILQHTAEKIKPDVANYNANGFSSTHGYGRVNAHRAVVPSVKNSTSQTQLRPNEPFTVTVTASAPYGLSEV